MGCIALGLHGPEVAVAVAKDQIDAAIRPPALRPVIPQPDLVDLRGPLGVGGQEPFDEMLELPATPGGIGVEAVEEFGDIAGHRNFEIDRGRRIGDAGQAAVSP